MKNQLTTIVTLVNEMIDFAIANPGFAGCLCFLAIVVASSVWDKVAAFIRRKQ